jgi:predicted esterase
MQRPRSFVVLLASFVTVSCGTLVSACGSSSTTASSGGRAMYRVPAAVEELTATAWYDQPWPSDLRREADGTVRVAGLYNPRENVLIEDYLRATKGLFKGFSPAASGFLRFTVPIDPKTLPETPAASLDPHASVQIIDVDPASPERGKRHLLETSWRRDEGVFWLPNTLAVAPALGYPLRPTTRYAIVVTKKVHGEDGGEIRPSDDLEAILGLRATTATNEKAKATLAPYVAELATAGIPAADIAHATFFTTNDPTSELFAIADAVPNQVPAPTVADASWAAKEERTDFDVYEGTYGPTPNYQQGNIPFKKTEDGGSFVFDAAGAPILQNTFTMRFSLAIPKAAACPPPAAGYPMVLYAHGTGGDYRSLVSEGNSVAQSLAVKCVASMGVDQIFHGTRPGAPPEGTPNREGEIQLTFFNLNNPLAARTSGRQSAVDVVQQTRLFTETHVTVPATISRTGASIGFDASRIVFYGHSQGGVNGPLYMAADSHARGGVLSGTGAMITIALLEKTKPEPSVAAAVKTLLQLFREEDEGELTLFHPVMSLAQMIVDATDPVHYMPRIISRPRDGFAPKSVYQTEGIAADGVGDSYAPPHGIEVASVALGLPRMAPGIKVVREAEFSGIADVTIPSDGLSGNLAGGQASGVLAQFTPAAKSDGHFVIFDVPAARAQAAGFCRNLADDPKGRVPPL